jgi:hypothetical protein
VGESPSSTLDLSIRDFTDWPVRDKIQANDKLLTRLGLKSFALTWRSTYIVLPCRACPESSSRQGEIRTVRYEYRNVMMLHNYRTTDEALVPKSDAVRQLFANLCWLFRHQVLELRPD